MKVLVVDDELPARQRLRSMINELDDCIVCAEAVNGSDALARTAELEPDLLLLDVRMPDMDGIEVARHIQQMNQPPAIIFTTAYGEYALPAFDTHAADYLLKPVRKERLGEALSKARRLSRNRNDAQACELGVAAARKQICARIRGNMTLIPVDDVRYFQADSKYITVGYDSGQVLIEDTIKSLENEFSDSFIRIHRNALISIKHIQGLERTADGRCQVCLLGVDERLEVSRRHLSALRRLIRDLHS